MRLINHRKSFWIDDHRGSLTTLRFETLCARKFRNYRNKSICKVGELKNLQEFTRTKFPM
jgi:hypothetical protein